MLISHEVNSKDKNTTKIKEFTQPQSTQHKVLTFKHLIT